MGYGQPGALHLRVRLLESRGCHVPARTPRGLEIQTFKNTKSKRKVQKNPRKSSKIKQASKENDVKHMKKHIFFRSLPQPGEAHVPQLQPDTLQCPATARAASGRAGRLEHLACLEPAATTSEAPICSERPGFRCFSSIFIGF